MSSWFPHVSVFSARPLAKSNNSDSLLSDACASHSGSQSEELVPVPANTDDDLVLGGQDGVGYLYFRKQSGCRIPQCGAAQTPLSPRGNGKSKTLHNEKYR